MSNECITRRAFIGAALGAGMLLISTPSVALADEQYAATPGRSIDPHSVSMAGSRTLSSISSSHCLTELRRGCMMGPTGFGSERLYIRAAITIMVEAQALQRHTEVLTGHATGAEII